MAVVRLRLFGGVELSTQGEGHERRLSVPPKPLALLAYLAVASAAGTPCRRDVLLALFWPELPTDRARGALRQLLFQLRRVVGPDGLRASRDTIALDPEALSCDVITFEERLASGDRAGAMEMYRGPLLDGFFLDGASAALEESIAGSRARLNAKAFTACTALADEARKSANGIAAAQWARAAAALAPDNEIALRRLVQTLDAFGDRAGALRVADDFVRRLAVEFGAMPSAETQALIAAIRTRRATTTVLGAHDVTAPGAPRVAPAPRIVEHLAVQNEPTVARITSRARRRFSLGGVALAAAIVIVVAAVALVTTRHGGATPSPRAPVRGITPPITIRSDAARGLYDQGIVRYEGGDPREASRLFIAALASDSDCAMCAYYASMSNMGADDAVTEQMLGRANRLASRVSEPERLLIHYRWADAQNSETRRAIADSLVARYPDWPEAQAAAADAAGIDGDLLAAEDHLRRAIAGDPLPSSMSNGPCPPCATRIYLISVYEAGDSLEAALRTAQALVRERPHARLSWYQLSHTLAASGRYAEARAAMDSSTRYATGTSDDADEHADIEIRAGNFSTADRLLTTIAQTGNADARGDAMWGLIISLRAQGRLREALDLTRGEFRRTTGGSAAGLGWTGIAEGAIEYELGHYAQAASIFERLATVGDTFSKVAEARRARQYAWMMTQAASAVAAEGDTVELSAMVDTVRAWGLKSGFGRDRRLFEYVRGLLWSARSRPDSAAAAFARATRSESAEFSRMNLMRARALVAIGRPQEGIRVLRNSLAGPLQGGNFYATRTDIQEELAEVYDGVGQLDSAAAYNRYVVNAWRDADPQFRVRLAHARERLAADERRINAERRSSAHASSQ